MNKKVNLPLPVLILGIIGLFLAGSTWQKAKVESNPSNPKATKKLKNIRFTPKKNEMPTIEVYLQSFGQKDKLLTANLKKAAEFFEGKVNWQPHYLFNKVDNPENNEFCLASENDTYYCSNFGKKGINQNIREICAWKLTSNKLNWWEFVNSAQENCALDKIDTCWQNEAKEAGLPVNQIQNCFSTEAIEIIEDEIKIFQDNKITQTPVVLINDVRLMTYENIGQTNPVVKIDDQYYNKEEINSREYYIDAVCASFQTPPNTCSK